MPNIKDLNNTLYNALIMEKLICFDSSQIFEEIASLSFQVG